MKTTKVTIDEHGIWTSVPASLERVNGSWVEQLGRAAVSDTRTYSDKALPAGTSAQKNAVGPVAGGKRESR